MELSAFYKFSIEKNSDERSANKIRIG